MDVDLEGLIKQDNVEELTIILTPIDYLRNNFNIFRHYEKPLTERSSKIPLLHIAVRENSQKVVEYLLSQDFVDKSICNPRGENIYHVICGIRGAEELFSIIERKVPHHLLLHNTMDGINAFHIACKENNVFIVKKVHEILETLNVDLTPINNFAMEYAIKNNDIEVIKYVSSIDGIQLNDDVFCRGIKSSKFDVVVYLLNDYLCQSIPSHLHNQFHIFQFIHHHIFKSSILPCNNNEIESDKNEKNNINSTPKKNNDYFKLVEENYRKLVKIKGYGGNRIWHEVCENENLDVVRLISSLKGIQAEILNNEEEYNVFLLACGNNSNIKVIKYIHKLFPSFIHSQIKTIWYTKNGAHLIISNDQLESSDKLKILHYLYLHGIDIHLLSESQFDNQNFYDSLFEACYTHFFNLSENMVQYLKVISQDFDYQNNPHDNESYRKPSFWKPFHNNNNNNNNNNNIADEQSMGINEWKNRFDEHVLHHLSKMIQQHMLES